jgi:hypothetical protein
MEPVEPAAASTVDADVVLARAILSSFDVSGRGHEGNRFMCEDEIVLRQWLTEDGVVNFDDATLSAALTLLETATLPSSRSPLLRGSDLHRRNRSQHLVRRSFPPRGAIWSPSRCS